MKRVGDESQVRIGLGMVSQRPAADRIDFFGQQAGRAGKVDIGAEELTGAVEVADQ